MKHLASPHELLEATFRERRRRGWAAVAPELEPYVDAQRWPSGLPLPEDLRTQVTGRTCPPPWFPHLSFAVSMPIVGAWLHFLCASLTTRPRWTDMHDDYDFPRPWTCGYRDRPNLACQPCIVLALLVISAVSLLQYGILRRNKAVREHVNCLYVLYAIARTDPAMPHELIFDHVIWRGMFKGPMKVSVFADGTYSMAHKIFMRRSRCQCGIAGAAGRSDGDACVPDACKQDHCQCQYLHPSSQVFQRIPGHSGAVWERFAIGNVHSFGGHRSASRAVRDCITAPLLPV